MKFITYKLMIFLAICFLPQIIIAQISPIRIVPSKNAVGYTKIKIPKPGNFNLVSINYRDIGGENLTLSRIFGTNRISQNSFLTTQDRIFIYDTSNLNYNTYFQKPNGSFYNVNNPRIKADNIVIPKGLSFWIKAGNINRRYNSRYSSPTKTNYFLFAGEIDGTLTNKQIFTKGLNTILFPYASYSLLNDPVHFVKDDQDFFNHTIKRHKVPTIMKEGFKKAIEGLVEYESQN